MGGEPTWIVATTSAVSLVKGGIAGSTTGDMWGGAPGRIAKAVLQNSCATPFVAVQSFYANEGKNISPDGSRALGGKIGSGDYTEIPLHGGHVGGHFPRAEGALCFLGWLENSAVAPISSDQAKRHIRLGELHEGAALVQ